MPRAYVQGGAFEEDRNVFLKGRREGQLSPQTWKGRKEVKVVSGL